MTQFTLSKVKDLGLQREVMEALPYAVVGGAWEGSFTENYDKYTALTHIVPAGQQLKVLFLRVWTEDANGAKFSIEQRNPTTGPGYPAVGSVPEGYQGHPDPFKQARDYPMLEAAGAEVIGPQPLNAPIHVLEGSIDFNILYAKASPYHYGIVYWGVQKTPE